MNIVLHEPEIPENTGNIGRTCVATGSVLHLIKPLGFVIDDKHLKRAGLDYWPKLEYHIYEDYEDFCRKNPGAKVFFATTKAHQTYSEIKFGPDDFIMFGKESAGIPEEILIDREEECIRIPMMEGERSINLCNSVSIVLFEALRQMDFAGLEKSGELHRLSWKE